MLLYKDFNVEWQIVVVIRTLEIFVCEDKVVLYDKIYDHDSELGCIDVFRDTRL